MGLQPGFVDTGRLWGSTWCLWGESENRACSGLGCGPARKQSLGREKVSCPRNLASRASHRLDFSSTGLLCSVQPVQLSTVASCRTPPVLNSRGSLFLGPLLSHLQARRATLDSCVHGCSPEPAVWPVSMASASVFSRELENFTLKHPEKT